MLISAAVVAVSGRAGPRRSPVATNPTDPLPSAAVSSRNVPQAAGRSATLLACHTRCTPTAVPRVVSDTIRARSKYAPFCTRTTIAGLCGASSAWRAETSSSSSASSGGTVAAVLARCRTVSGECGELVCGTQSSHAQSARSRLSRTAAITTSAGECRPTSWARTARTAALAVPPAPATPIGDSRRSATTGTSGTVAKASCTSRICCQRSGVHARAAGILTSVRLGAAARPRRTCR